MLLMYSYSRDTDVRGVFNNIHVWLTLIGDMVTLILFIKGGLNVHTCKCQDSHRDYLTPHLCTEWNEMKPPSVLNNSKYGIFLSWIKYV